MANKKDYSEIKKRRNYLPNFMVNWNRLPEYLAETNQEVQSLQILSTVVGEMIIGSSELTQGSPFIIGKKYNVETLEAGDDFTNIGYVSEGVSFIATGTTPTTWTNNSYVSLILEELNIFYNDLDPTITIENAANTNYNIKITNNSFLVNKTFPNIVGGSNISVTDDNTINFSAQNQPKYFKIEVYV